MRPLDVISFIAIAHFTSEAFAISVTTDANRELKEGPKLRFVGNPPGRILGICEGDCDKDDDCEGDLKCFLTDSQSGRIPGCSIGGDDNTSSDFCYDEAGTLPPTPSPTSQPSSAPTISIPPTKYVPPMIKFVGNPNKGHSNPLGICEGDCDDDDECQGNLKCFIRNGTSQRVPGCAFGGDDDRTFDVCYDESGTLPPTTSPTSQPSSEPSISNFPSVTPTTPPTKIPKLKNRGINPGKLLRLCEGDCDTDADCKQGLSCFRRAHFFTKVPGCTRGGDDYVEMDVCYQPFPSSQPTAHPTNGPTFSAKPSNFPSAVPTNYPELKYIGNPATNLGLCEGDCDQDSDCQPGLQCYFRKDRREEVPGCSKSGGDLGNRGFDVCFRSFPSQSPSQTQQPSEPPTTSSPTKSRKPTSNPTPNPTREHFSSKVMQQMKYFQLKQYWKKGYFWQESTSERKFCAETRTSSTGNKIEIQNCSSGDKKQRWRFYEYNRFMIESYYSKGKCIGRDGIWLTLRTCDISDKNQRWHWIGKTDRKFEWQPLRESDQCVTNEHHPSSGEGLKVMRCRTAKNEETNYWTVYD